jgi:carotenoid cleavage dioxygenase-like enzyme
MEPPYTAGLESIDREFDRIECSVEGTIPSWLSGTLLRNGPGHFEVGGQPLNHWFDGLAMLRRFRIQDGSVSVSNRFLRSREYEHVTREGELRCDQFGTTAPSSVLDRLREVMDPTLTDNASISVDRIGQQPIAITETPNAVAFDAETLATEAGVDHNDGLSITGSLGHPHYDFAREMVVNMGVEFGRKSEYVLFERPTDSRIRREIGRFAVDRPAYFHSFGLTERYAILLESPLRLDRTALLRHRPFIENYSWDDGLPSRFLIFDRESGAVVSRPAVDPYFVFHHVNAFELPAENRVVVDVIAFEDSEVIQSLSLDRLRSGEEPVPGGKLRRYRLPIEDGAVEEESLFPGPIEFPMINYRQVSTRPYRYLYASGHTNPPAIGLLNCLVKYDLETGSQNVWHEPGVYPTEPVFVDRVPAPVPGVDTGTAEDDGVVLSVLLDTRFDRSALLVLDAASFSELARARLPAAFPFGFHGQWYPDDGQSHRTMP